MTDIKDGPRPVLTKRDFVERYISGEFGNRPQTWGTLKEFLADGRRDDGELYHIRNRVAGAATWYNVSSSNVEKMWNSLSKIYPSTLLYISRMGPEDRKVFQGEIMDCPGGLHLLYNTQPLPMRNVNQEDWKTVRGLVALLTLQHYLCENSYPWMLELLRQYPEHVIEFSTYSINWGSLPGFNTIFWEVRRY